MVLAVDIIPYAKYAWKRCTGHEITPEQLDDIQFLCTHRKNGLFASRGYGKTLMMVILESFLASRGWKTRHCFTNVSQAAQWHTWFKKLGWEDTLWHATWGEYKCQLALYAHGRGDRVDCCINDEIGTVISEIERQAFNATQDCLSGSPLGFAKYVGTRDPNSIQSKYAQNVRLRPYNALTMPWVTMQYEDAKLHNSPPYMDCEYHMKATAAGGRVMQFVRKLPDYPFSSQRYAIDTNPTGGFYITGVFDQPYPAGLYGFVKGLYVTEVLRFDQMDEVADFVISHKQYPIFLETNGVGAMLYKYFELRGCHDVITKVHVTEESKYESICQIAPQQVFLKESFDNEVYECYMKQIWKDKKHIEKFNDAHHFDSFYLAASGVPIIWT